MAEEDLIDENSAEDEDQASTDTPSINTNKNKKRIIIITVIGLVLLLVVVLFALKVSNSSDALVKQDKQTNRALDKNQLEKNKQNEEKAKLKQQEKDRKDEEKAKIEAEKKAAAEKKKKERELKNIKYIKVYENLVAEQAANVLRELSMARIRFNSVQKGKYFSIEIEESRVEDAKNMLAIKGLPSGGAKGYELFDAAQGMGVTEFDKRIRFIRAISGELEKAISQFDCIEMSKVQIVLPEQKLFSTTQPPVTASILIRKVPGREITDDVVLAIIELVSNAVENLKPENISVIDTEGVVLSKDIFERLGNRNLRMLDRHRVSLDTNLTSANILSGTTTANIVTMNTKLAQVSANQTITENQIALSTTANKIPRPDLSYLSDWFGFKENFENLLIKKAENQLEYVLPRYMFKINVTADMGKLNKDGLPNINHLSTNVLIDGTKIDVYIDKTLKEKVLNVVQSSIGYIDGRDTLNITVTDTPLMSPDEIAKLNKKAQIFEETNNNTQADRGSPKKLMMFQYKFNRIYQKYEKYTPYAVSGIFVGVAGLILLAVKRPKKLITNDLAKDNDDDAKEPEAFDFSSLRNTPKQEIQEEQSTPQELPLEEPTEEDNSIEVDLSSPTQEDTLLEQDSIKVPEVNSSMEQAPEETTIQAITPSENIEKIANTIALQKPQVILFILSKLTEPLKGQIISYLPSNLLENLKDQKIEQVPAATKIYQYIYDDLFKNFKP